MSWLSKTFGKISTALSSRAISTAISRGDANTNFETRAPIVIKNDKAIASLPSGLRTPELLLKDCPLLAHIPEDVSVGKLTIEDCPSLKLPVGFHSYDLKVTGESCNFLPEGLVVTNRLDLSNCTTLESLPLGIQAGSLILNGCTSLRSLPEDFDVTILDIAGCINLSEWPKSAKVHTRLVARNCSSLTRLPEWMERIGQVDLRGCSQLSVLPDRLRAISWIDVADTALRGIPPSTSPMTLRWRGVPVDERIAFRPETITAAEIVSTVNAELRQVMLSRMGYDRFVMDSDAEVLDRDTDPGGERRLLRVRLGRDEPLVCLNMSCPSTGRSYVVRVPPDTKTCRKAAAWIAGFDNEKDYRPTVET